jgi:hypothetical protein
MQFGFHIRPNKTQNKILAFFCFFCTFQDALRHQHPTNMSPAKCGNNHMPTRRDGVSTHAHATWLMISNMYLQIFPEPRACPPIILAASHTPAKHNTEFKNPGPP